MPKVTKKAKMQMGGMLKGLIPGMGGSKPAMKKGGKVKMSKSKCDSCK